VIKKNSKLLNKNKALNIRPGVRDAGVGSSNLLIPTSFQAFWKKNFDHLVIKINWYQKDPDPSGPGHDIGIKMVLLDAPGRDKM